LLCQKLWSDELVLIMPGGHPQAGRKPVSVKQLRETPFILRQKGIISVPIFSLPQLNPTFHHDGRFLSAY
jgi:DNA-binding transcriptional LysR family regulator